MDTRDLPLVNRNAEAMKAALDSYRRQTEELIETNATLQASVNMLTQKVTTLEQQVTMMMAVTTGSGPTT